MQAERDYLVRFVFPRLRQELLARRVHLLETDLRWGVTSEQNVVEVCREIIDECRPRFLCTLGGRYGHIPHGHHESITADEIRYAVLERPEYREFAFFFFRDETSTAAIAERRSGEYREPAGSEAARRLAALKREIRDARCRVVVYRARWDPDAERLVDLQEFGDEVYRRLLESIDRELGSAAPPPLDPFEEQRQAMARFVVEHSQQYVVGSRQSVLARLRQHALDSSGPPLVLLVGEHGSGKTALLAHLCREWEADGAFRAGVVCHFVGAGPESADVRQLVRALCHESQKRLGIREDIPEDYGHLCDCLSHMLDRAGRQGRLVIVVDAVDQLGETGQTPSFNWLPASLQPNVRWVLSATPGPTADAVRLAAASCAVFELPPLDRLDAAAIIEEFLARYHKRMEVEQKKLLLSKLERDGMICEDAPLYLHLILEELRTAGRHDQITQRIRELPAGVEDAFAWVLDRLASEDLLRWGGGAAGRDLVPGLARLLAVSRGGLSEEELARVLQSEASPEAWDDQRAVLAAVLLMLRPYLMRRHELLDFCHEQFRASVRHHCLPPGERLATHGRLAHFFSHSDPDSRRALSELGYHMAEAARCEVETAVPREAMTWRRRLFQLMQDEDYRTLQVRHLRSREASRQDLARALELFARTSADTGDEEAAGEFGHLCWLALRAGDFAGQARGHVLEALDIIETRPLADSARATDALERLEDLGESAYALAIWVLLVAEAGRQAENPATPLDRTPSRELFQGFERHLPPQLSVTGHGQFGSAELNALTCPRLLSVLSPQQLWKLISACPEATEDLDYRRLAAAAGESSQPMFEFLHRWAAGLKDAGKRAEAMFFLAEASRGHDQGLAARALEDAVSASEEALSGAGGGEILDLFVAGLVRAGQSDRAADMLGRLLGDAEAVPQADRRLDEMCRVARQYLALGRRDLAATAFDRTFAAMDAIRDPDTRATCLAGLAGILADADLSGRVERCLEAIGDDYPEQRQLVRTAMVLPLARAGKFAAAAAMLKAGEKPDSDRRRCLLAARALADAGRRDLADQLIARTWEDGHSALVDAALELSLQCIRQHQLETVAMLFARVPELLSRPSSFQRIVEILVEAGYRRRAADLLHEHVHELQLVDARWTGSKTSVDRFVALLQIVGPEGKPADLLARCEDPARRLSVLVGWSEAAGGVEADEIRRVLDEIPGCETADQLLLDLGVRIARYGDPKFAVDLGRQIAARWQRYADSDEPFCWLEPADRPSLAKIGPRFFGPYEHSRKEETAREWGRRLSDVAAALAERGRFDEGQAVADLNWHQASARSASQAVWRQRARAGQLEEALARAQPAGLGETRAEGRAIVAAWALASPQADLAARTLDDALRELRLEPDEKSRNAALERVLEVLCQEGDQFSAAARIAADLPFDDKAHSWNRLSSILRGLARQGRFGQGLALARRLGALNLAFPMITAHAATAAGTADGRQAIADLLTWARRETSGEGRIDLAAAGTAFILAGLWHEGSTCFFLLVRSLATARDSKPDERPWHDLATALAHAGRYAMAISLILAAPDEHLADGLRQLAAVVTDPGAPQPSVAHLEHLLAVSGDEPGLSACVRGRRRAGTRAGATLGPGG